MAAPPVSLAPFFPPFLVDDLRRARLGAEPPWQAQEPMALLLSDITGYTALTERLQSRGREGAEEVARVLGRVFQPAIEAIGQTRGSVTCVGGDALFTLFRGPTATRRAHAAALSIRTQFRDRGPIATSVGPVELTIKQALHHGPVASMHLGRPGRRCYLAAGAAVAALARLEATASGDRIVVSRAAAARLRAEPPRRERERSRALGEVAGLESYLDPRLVPFLRRPGSFRPVTVLFLETAGTRLQELQHFFLALGDVLDGHEGVLVDTDVSRRGTKWLCAFGLPTAHEHDTVRAGRAAIELCSRLGAGPPLRAAIHRGIVAMLVVGAPSRRALSTFGDAVNTAARTLEHARWGETLVTEEARAGLHGIATARRGARRMKGKAEMMALHTLGRSEEATGRELRVSAPLVGREHEAAALEDALEAAAAGRGRVLALRGEAGIGKSRLKWEAERIARTRGFRVFEGRCQSFAQEPWHAIADLLHAMVAGSPADAVRALGLHADVALVLTDVMGLPLEPPSAARLFSGQDGRERSTARHAAIASFLKALSDRGPVLAILEDLHWADAGTREAVAHLAGTASRAPHLLLLLLHREGYDPPPGARCLELRPLAREQMSRLVRAILGTAPADVIDALVARADGNPLFAEELARHLLERGLGASGMRVSELPPTVETLIAARLDGLALAALQAAELGATFGRSFPEALLNRLAEVGGLTDGDVAAAREELLAHQILFVRREHPQRELVFKHALTREAAYRRVLVSERRRWHRFVAEYVGGLPPDERDRSLAVLGHHWEHAGEAERAAEAYLGAARQAYGRYVSEESVELYRRALQLLPGRGPAAIRAQADMAAGPIARLGRTEEALAIARAADDAARRRGADARLRARTSYALGYVSSNAGQLDRARVALARAVRIARRAGDVETETRAAIYVASIHADQGRPDEAARWAGRARSAAERAGDDYARGRSIFMLAHLAGDRGKFEAALALYEEALPAAWALRDEAFEGLVQNNKAALLVSHGLYEEALAVLERELERHKRYRLPTLENYAIFNLGVALSHQGQEERGLALLRDALARSAAAADRRLECYALEALAHAHLERGEFASALLHAKRGAALGRVLADPRIVAAFQVARARLERVAGGRLAAASARLARAESALRGLCDWQGRVQCLCERGHLALARRRPARAASALAAARALLPSYRGAPVRSREIERLTRAIAEFETGASRGGRRAHGRSAAARSR